MAQLYQNIGHLVLLLVLLAASAFFSATETAFFNLSPRQIALLKKSKHRIPKLVAGIIASPSKLLSCLLFGNMTVNILFFAVASVMAVRIERQIGIAAAVLTAIITFIILVLFGEILPKSIAYANSKSISTAAALPLVLVLRLLAPLLFVFRFFIVAPAIRLILGPVKKIGPVTTAEFKSLIDNIGKRGLITDEENRLLSEIVELGFLKVRDCLQPRVDMITCDVTDSNQQMCRIMQKNHLTKIPVYVKRIDNIVGMVHLPNLLLNCDTSPDKLVQKVHFVPEQKTIESLLEFFRQTHTDTAVVVDEYGGIAGSITLEDIAEELLGPIEPAEQPQLIEKIGPLRYRLAGNLAIHDWAQTFGIDLTQTQIATIGGLVTALLGKIPKEGDTAKLKNLKFTVEQLQKHRIKTVILTLEPITENNHTKQQ